MKITTLQIHPAYSNTYVLGEEGKPCVLIDPGYPSNSGNSFEKYINKHHGGICKAIILTHSHFDHYSGMINSSMLQSIPTYIHSDDIQGLTDDEYNCAWMCGESRILDIDPIPVNDGDVLNFDDIKLEVIHTPFHSKGSICLFNKEEKILFSGDTLFNRSIGRTDLKSSCPRLMAKSLEKLKKLPLETVVYPGHGRTTTIEIESQYGYLNSNP